MVVYEGEGKVVSIGIKGRRYGSIYWSERGEGTVVGDGRIDLEAIIDIRIGGLKSCLASLCVIPSGDCNGPIGN